jgi:hypothetical protein
MLPFRRRQGFLFAAVFSVFIRKGRFGAEAAGVPGEAGLFEICRFSVLISLRLRGFSMGDCPDLVKTDARRGPGAVR